MLCDNRALCGDEKVKYIHFLTPELHQLLYKDFAEPITKPVGYARGAGHSQPQLKPVIAPNLTLAVVPKKTILVEPKKTISAEPKKTISVAPKKVKRDLLFEKFKIYFPDFQNRAGRAVAFDLWSRAFGGDVHICDAYTLPLLRQNRDFALHGAALGGRQELVGYFLDMGASPSRAFYAAVRGGNRSVIGRFIAGWPKFRPDYGLELAAFFGNNALVQFFMSIGARDMSRALAAAARGAQLKTFDFIAQMMNPARLRTAQTKIFAAACLSGSTEMVNRAIKLLGIPANKSHCAQPLTSIKQVRALTPARAHKNDRRKSAAPSGGFGIIIPAAGEDIHLWNVGLINAGSIAVVDAMILRGAGNLDGAAIAASRRGDIKVLRHVFELGAGNADECLRACTIVADHTFARNPRAYIMVIEYLVRLGAKGAHKYAKIAKRRENSGIANCLKDYV